MKKVLIINDSGFERMVLRDQVHNLGFEVKTADEFTGFSLIEKFHPDIVIANLTMADTSGDELIEQIKGMDPATKCLLSTCSMNQRFSYDSKVIDGVLETPTTMEYLLTLLNNLESDNLSMQAAAKPARIAGPSNECPSDYDELSNTPLTKVTGVVKPVVFAFCPSCGEMLEKSQPDFIFCPFCGSHL